MGFATGFLDHPKLSNVHLSQGDKHAEAQQSDLIFPEQGYKLNLDFGRVFTQPRTNLANHRMLRTVEMPPEPVRETLALPHRAEMSEGVAVLAKLIEDLRCKN